MAQYKRNQIEEAISRTLEQSSAKPSSELRTRLKRLLDMDRSLGRNARSTDPQMANYAFFSSDMPGRGIEIWFSDYEAFALLTGLLLLRHGWPQSFAVGIMRRLRPDLEKQHGRILKQDPKILFDAEVIRQSARPGALYVNNTDPVFLTIVSRQASSSENNSDIPPCGVCRGLEEVSKFLEKEKAQSHTLMDLVTPAHALSYQLQKAQPRKRGRSS
jgi:hypothetical protein